MASCNSNDNSVTNEVLVEEHLKVRTLILNRPNKLNALSFLMVSQLLKHFSDYEENENVQLVIVKGNGRAFSAGGDIAEVAHDLSNGNWRLAAKRFWNVYLLTYMSATFSKTQISILNGIVMGGGAGISIHGRFRVATENSVFAMPEAALGLFPDVGASYFLSRLSGFFGEYVGLTGARLDGAEMLSCGLATHFVPSSRLTLLEQELHKVMINTTTGNLIFILSAILDKFSKQPPLKGNSAYHRLDIINRCFSRRTVEEILFNLEIEASDSVNKDLHWISTAIQSLKKASPTSLKITLRSIREGRFQQSVGQCLIQDYRLSCHVFSKQLITNDFVEGYRASLLDKEGNPKWNPSKLELVTDTMVNHYFLKSTDHEEWEDLVLPIRAHLKPAVCVMAKL